MLEAGSFGFSADWAAVQARLAAEGLRSLAYDRAGLGLSDPGPEPRDSQAIVGDLEALLAALGETGPLDRLRPLDGWAACAPVRRAATPSG